MRDDDVWPVQASMPLMVLDNGARPLPFGPLRLDETHEYRDLTCTHYSGCLEFARRCNWPGFHCLRCPSFTGRTDG